MAIFADNYGRTVHKMRIALFMEFRQFFPKIFINRHIIRKHEKIDYFPLDRPFALSAF
jgi:hypothetical protein